MAVSVAELDKFVRDMPPHSKVPRRLKAGDRLFLEVRRPGADVPRASWVLRFTYGGKKQSMGLGSYFSQAQRGVGGVTLKQAGESAALKLAEIDKGLQPVKEAREKVKRDTADRKARKELEARNVRLAAEQWHDATKGKLTSDKYRAQRWKRLEEYLDHIGHIPVAQLTVADVSDAFYKLGADDRAETFRRSSADLEKSVEYAVSQGWFDGVNPVQRARKGLTKPEKIGRRSFESDKLPEYIIALSKLDDSQTYPVAAHLLRILTLTAARTKEVRLLKWTDIQGLDTDTATAHVSADRMKGRKAWSIPLSTQVVDLLREIARWQQSVGAGLKGVASGFVFVRLDGNYKGRLCSENAANDLLKGMGWHSVVTGHGLRKVFSTVGHSAWPYSGANRTEAIEFSLAHGHADKVRGIYDKNLYMDQRRALMQWWADHLDRAREKGGNVVEFKKAG